MILGPVSECEVEWSGERAVVLLKLFHSSLGGGGHTRV